MSNEVDCSCLRHGLHAIPFLKTLYCRSELALLARTADVSSASIHQALCHVPDVSNSIMTAERTR